MLASCLPAFFICLLGRQPDRHERHHAYPVGWQRSKEAKQEGRKAGMERFRPLFLRSWPPASIPPTIVTQIEAGIELGRQEIRKRGRKGAFAPHFSYLPAFLIFFVSGNRISTEREAFPEEKETPPSLTRHVLERGKSPSNRRGMCHCLPAGTRNLPKRMCVRVLSAVPLSHTARKSPGATSMRVG